MFRDKKIYPLLSIVVPFGMGFYLSYLYRSINLVIEPQLRAEFGLSASALGFITGLYFVSFALAQLPLGVAVDRYGPRKVQVVLTAIAVGGGLLFALSTSVLWLAVSRLIIGLGVAGGITPLITANALWFSQKEQPLVNSIGLCFGGLGALSATTPVQILLEHYSWREIFFLISGLSILLLVVLCAYVPERRKEPIKVKTTWFMQILWVYKRKQFWQIGALPVTGFAAYTAYQCLWAGPFLRDVNCFGSMETAEILMWLQVGMLFGTLGSGVLANYFSLSGPALKTFVFWSISLFIFVQLVIGAFPTFYPYFSWFLYGYLGSFLFLCYSIFTQAFGALNTGRVVACCNILMFLGVFGLQWAIGWFIDPMINIYFGSDKSSLHQLGLLLTIIPQFCALMLFLRFNIPKND